MRCNNIALIKGRTFLSLHAKIKYWKVIILPHYTTPKKPEWEKTVNLFDEHSKLKTANDHKIIQFNNINLASLGSALVTILRMMNDL